MSSFSSLDVDVGGGDGGARTEGDGPPRRRVSLLRADERQTPTDFGGRLQHEDDVRGLPRVRHRQQDVPHRRVHPQHVHHSGGIGLGHAAPAVRGCASFRQLFLFLRLGNFDG